MRLSEKYKKFIKETSSRLFPDTTIYLFGSRVDDNAFGGDIDLLLISESKVDSDKIRIFRREFYKAFGWQKIDLVNFTKTEQSVFKDIALTDAVRL